MNKQDFTDYARAFSAGDYEGYSRFYTEDVVLELGSVGELRGRDRIVGFYREMNLAVQERLTAPLGRRLNAADRFDDDVRVAAEDVVDRGHPGDACARIERAALSPGATVENLGQGDVA